MNYTKKSFSVVAPGTQAYRDNYERTFGSRCGALFPNNMETNPLQLLGACALAKGHEDQHSVDFGLNGIWRWGDDGVGGIVTTHQIVTARHFHDDPVVGCEVPCDELECRPCPKCGEPFKRTFAGGEECKNGHEGRPCL